MQQIMGAFDSSYDLFRRKICGKSYSWSYPSQDPSALRHYLISMEKKLWFAALGGCLSWAVYLAVEFITPSPYVCGFWSTVAITLYAECMARIHKTLVTVFLVSATIPLIPGAALYRTMNWMLMKDWAKFQKDGIYTILFAVSMAAGMTLTTIAFRMAWRWMYRQRRM